MPNSGMGGSVSGVLVFLVLILGVGVLGGG